MAPAELKIPRIRGLFPIALAFLLFASPALATKQALFDNYHAETAGNADWQIDIDQPVPVPDQGGINSATLGTYWTGAISSWGVRLVQLGYTVTTNDFPLTYGDAFNPYDLSNYDVLIVDEPNTRFGAAETAAIFSFIDAGGGLVGVADHSGSDRNNDGYDSPMIWNLVDPANLLGVSFGTSASPNNNIVQTSLNVNPAASDSVTHGPIGNVAALAFHNGTTMTLYPDVNPTVRGEVWMSGLPQSSLTGVMAASSFYGSGRVVFVGDSSPVDDGTAAPGNSSIFNGWGELGTTDSTLFLNATLWVTRRPVSVGVPPPVVSLSVRAAPNPLEAFTTISYVLPVAGATSLSIFDASGRLVRRLASAHESEGAHAIRWNGSSADGRRSPAGVYWYRFDSPAGAASGKLVLLR